MLIRPTCRVRFCQTARVRNFGSESKTFGRHTHADLFTGLSDPRFCCIILHSVGRGRRLETWFVGTAKRLSVHKTAFSETIVLTPARGSK